MITITFNTGRLYTREGQIITAHYDDEVEVLTFNDHSRMITGQYPLASTSCFPMTPSFLATRLMSMYDRGGYDYSVEAWKLRRQDQVHQFRL